MYLGLIEWASGDPYRDGWGGSGLSSLALWRWLKANETQFSGADEARRVLQAAERLRRTRLMRGMFDTELLETLPQLEEDIVRRLARLAWKVGEQEQARRLFLDYLSLATTADLDRAESALLDSLIASDLASRDRLALFRGRRLASIGKYDDALPLFSEARRSPDREVRAAAGLELARLEPILDEAKKGVDRNDIAERLDSVLEDAGDSKVAQDALFTRAILLNREGPGRDVPASERDLRRIVKEFPDGQLADQALYELARGAEDRQDSRQALGYYSRLRDFAGQSDRIDSAYVRPALLLYTRNDPGDRAAAAWLLQELVDRYPASPFWLKARFWLGRIASEEGASDRAREYFESVIQKSPFDYYALRARMWLAAGESAAKTLWPTDARVREEIRTTYMQSTVASDLRGQSRYHLRLRDAIRTGLYGLALNANARLRERFPNRRLEQVSLEELDRAEILASLAVLLALRQDALAANDSAGTPGNRLEIAGAVGRGAGDWPLALRLVQAAREPSQVRAAAQRDPHYLATAYPRLFPDEIARSSAQWDVKPELLYSIMRIETLFNSAALSPRGALGLFQFTHTTFETLDRRWRLLEGSAAPSREAFLTNPKLAIELGARWFKQELLRHQDGDILHAIMEHNAGDPAVRSWKRGWRRLGREDDIEYMVETARFAETQLFTRRVIADAVIVDAAQLLRERTAEAK